MPPNKVDISKEPPISFSTDEETIDKIVRIVLSGDYWVFIFATAGSALTIMNKIEYQYYTPKTDANADFGLIMSLSVSYVVAKKTRMNRQQLAEILFSFIKDKEKRQRMESDFMNVKSQDDSDVIPMSFGTEDKLNRMVMRATAHIADFYQKVKTGT